MRNLLFKFIRKIGLLNLIVEHTTQIQKINDGKEYYKNANNNALFDDEVILLNKPSIENNQEDKSKIHIMKGSVLNNCHLLVFKHGGRIEIGEDCFIGQGTKIWSASEIIIGNRVLISHNVNIHDNNSHDLDSQKRHLEFIQIWKTGLPEIANYNEKPIIIGNDVWIGFNCVIAKGVTIGDGAIIGHSSFVKNDILPFTIVAGNPAKIIGSTK